MPSDSSLGAQVRAALGAALLLALFQMIAETALIAAILHRFIVSPYLFFQTQMYDFCVKLFLLLPGAAEWIRGGALDRFLAPGIYSKLGLLGALAIPNVVIASCVGLVIAGARFALRRPARLWTALWLVAVFGVLVHLASFAAAVHMPKSWSVAVLARNLGRVAIWDGAYIAFAALGLGAAAAAALSLSQSSVRWAVSLSGVSLAAAALLLTTSASTASNGNGNLRYAGGRVAGRLAPVDNVILISIDSLRADRVGCYGNTHDTTPTLDRLARQGVRFADATSTTSWTLPSHASMLTGRYLMSHGIYADADRLPPSVPTLAEGMKAAGLTTGGIVSMLFLGSQYGFARGFDSYDDRTIPAKNEYDAVHDEPAPKVVALANKWLQQHGDHRFFLFLHFWDVHYDYVPPPPYDTMFDPDYSGSITGVNFLQNDKVRRGMPKRDLEHLLALYDGEIRWVDDHIAQIVAQVDALGLSDRTAIIVTADHGDEFFEHGNKGHRRTLYREVVHVPLIMKIPGVAPGSVIDKPVSLADLMPTILEMAGAETPPGVDGVSLVPAILGAHLADHARVYSELCRKHDAECRTLQYSPDGALVHHFEPSRIEFYGPGDPAEKHNLARGSEWPHEKQLAYLGEWLNEHWLVFRGLENERGSIEMDKATQDRLRALGYGDDDGSGHD